jgi:hypothetical protein
MMVLKERAGNHPEAEAIRESVFRGLSMPQKRRFKQKILGGIRQVALRSPAGLHLGKALSYEVDLIRIKRVVERITRGLYWHHYDHARLPDDCSIMVWPEDGFRKMPPEEIQQLRNKIVDPILNNPVHSIGRDVLRYYYTSGDLDHVTGWLYEFFGDVRFLAFTGPKSVASNNGIIGKGDKSCDIR